MTLPMGQNNTNGLPPNQKVNRAKELTYLSVTIDLKIILRSFEKK